VILNQVSEPASRIEVFQCRPKPPSYATLCEPAHDETRVKLNRVFFPRSRCKVRSLCCAFAR